jgi:hypothetical protein
VWIREDFTSENAAVPAAEKTLPPMTASRACAAVEPYDALLFLGDSNTRHLFLATLAHLSGNIRLALCPNRAPVWNPNGLFERKFLSSAGAAAISARASPAEIAAFLCATCYDGRHFGVSPDDPCRNFFPLNHSLVLPAHRPCGGRVAFHLVSCGPCEVPPGAAQGPVHEVVALAARYKNPLIIAGFGIHASFDIATVRRNVSPLLLYWTRQAAAAAAAAPGAGPRLRGVWVEPLARKESMVPAQFIRSGQNNTSAGRLSQAMRVTLQHLEPTVAILSGTVVSPAMGAGTYDGTHMYFPASLVRAELLLLGIEHRREL